MLLRSHRCPDWVGVEGVMWSPTLLSKKHQISRGTQVTFFPGTLFKWWGWETEMGQMEKWGMVRKMVETPDILALQGPGGTTPFNCQHFSIGAKSEQLFPLKIRKALKFPHTEDQA